MIIVFENIALMPIAAIFASAAFYFAVIKSRAPAILRILRGFAIALALTSAAGMSVTFREEKPKKTLAALIDVSDSMFLSARSGDICRYFKKNLKSLESVYRVELFTFAGALKSIRPSQIYSLEKSGPTDIKGALRELQEAFGSGIDGILLFSDGVQTAAETVSSSSRQRQNNTYGNIPVFALDVFTERGDVRDVSLADVKPPAFSFKGSRNELAMNVRSRGFNGLGAVVTLQMATGDGAAREYAQISSATLTLREGDNPLNLPFAAAKTGRIEYRVSVSTFAGETTRENNSKAFAIDVLRDKLRVLYLCGRPSYEYAFLRDFLKNDFGIELVTFVILRNPENVALVPDEELSLIPFPGADVLMNRLPDFDVVIFENFTFERFGIYSPHFEVLKKWVGDGGGFLMMGGENSFAGGGYARTPIVDMLPVTIGQQKEPEETGLFAPVTADGAEELLYGRDEDVRVRKNLPKLDWLQIMSPRAGAKVPIKHPWARTTSLEAAPVLALLDFRAGRTAALATNSTWRWRMGSADRVYETFWKNLLSWLASARDDTARNIIGPPQKAIIGEDVEFLVKKLSPAGRISATVAGPDGRRETLKESGNGGDYAAFAFAPKTSGRHTIEITESVSGAALRKSFKSFVAGPYWADESSNLEVDREFLGRLAQETGGLYVSADMAAAEGGLPSEEISKRLKSSPREAGRTSGEASTPTVFFAAVVLVILAELALRWKRYGLW
ncbi:MAG: hypothetical protein CVU77_08770 [Elusimicrobia bacterium HGW-Elusimicrobia-1]|jgi:uncharacterized membrane protein|nr:MAG: hypothetical protein CVU77_08770 [Elusimicrobia bacterium HGW-Elusimicrobia-1]